MARRALAQQFGLETFSDAASMLESLSNGGAPDVLVLDWRLPGMSGIEVCRFVRSSLDAVALPILMLTVQGEKVDVVEGLSAGANDYLTKPYDAAELLARATSLYRMRQLSHEIRVERARQQELLVEAQEASSRAEQANRAKDDFLATVSHELRTPLNAIVGWVKLLRNGTVPAERVADALDTIDRNVRAQTQLIDDLLDVSRIISGKLSLCLEPTDLAQVVRAAADALSPAAHAKQISIVCDIQAPDAPTLGDAVRLQQIVWNLLANAVKFTPQGGHVEVTLQSTQAGTCLTVRDDGQGIPARALPHIFDRFKQADSSFSRSHGGLGLGLAIVRHIVDLHGGSVGANSDGLGQGATFSVLLPRMEACAIPIRPRESSPPQPTAPDRLAGLRILLVDDDDDGREVTALFLRQHGALVDTVSSARAALAALDRSVPDILLSDIGMPEEDGLSLLRKVRSRSRAAGGGMPALALTAYARPEDRTRSLQAGFNSYVTKPVEPTDLILAVANLMGRFEREHAGG